MSGLPQNMDMEVSDDGVLSIRVNLNCDCGPSSTGKTRLVASSRGGVKIRDFARCSRELDPTLCVLLNVTRIVPPAVNLLRKERTETMGAVNNFWGRGGKR